MKFDKKIKEIIKRIEKVDDEECKALKEELDSLLDICHRKDQRFQKILKLSDGQQKKILELNEELHIYKTQLEQKVEEEIAKRKAQENLLFEQSRLAMIAEMIDAIAHQWKQPLNLLWLKTEILSQKAKSLGSIKSDVIEEFKKDSAVQIEHLIDTLDNFRDFFKPNQTQQKFSLLNSIQSVLQLIDEDLHLHSIEIEISQEEDLFIYGNENEFKHILLNLISNSKYAFIDNNISSRKIKITIDGKNKKMSFEDNAGGIDEEVIDRLFEKRVTTKADDEGSGMGLYMSQQIAKKHNGELSAYNVENGAVFVFTYKGE